MPPPQDFAVFLSHNSQEKPAVERIAEKLKREGIEPWLDKWCLTTGGDWQDELASGMRASSSCAVFVGPKGIGNWERLEFKLATDRMAKDRGFRVFLVLLPELPEPFDTSVLPPFLTTRTWVDMRRGITDGRAFQQLVNAIKGLAPGPEMPIQPRDDICPYRGLQTFDEEHAEFFFGRDGDRQRLVEKLKTTRLLAVLGPSGSGKSSLVRAGLLPALKKGALPASDEWSIQTFTPGARPLTQLAANLQRLYPQAAVGKTLDELSADERAFHLQVAVALADRPAALRAVWVVDQFEEVFTLCNDEAERKQFIANLLYAALAPGGRSLVVLTMRADFYQKCAAYPELSAQIIGQQFLVSPMSVEGLRQAIQEPAWRTGLEFEPGLVETILDDVESQPGALPLLEHALLELWERRRARLLTLEAYRESGGVEGAIAKRADTIYEAFDSEQQSIVRRVMLRLTQPGEGTEDTRRRARMSELITHAGEAGKVESVVQAMADARLLTTDSSEDAAAQTVDVAHEALIRSWPRLRRWIDEDRQGLRVLRRVTEAAQEWQKASRDESLLFRGARLSQALELRERSRAALNDLERDFLTASAELRDREQRSARRRTRRIIIGLAVALILISVALIYAIRQSRIATQRGTESRARELAANAMAQFSTDPELALILAIEAAKTAHSPETEHTLRQALARAPLHVFQANDPNHTWGQKATFSPDGKTILIANGQQLQTYDAESGNIILDLKEDGAVDGVAYSPDAKLVAAISGGAAHIREAATGRTVMKQQNPENTSFEKRAVFSPDSKFIILYNLVTSQVVEISSGRIIELVGGYSSFSRDGKLLLTAKGEWKKATLFLYDTKDWKPLGEIPTVASTEQNYPLGALSPEGTRAFAGKGKDVGIYDINQKQFIKTIRIGPVEVGEVYNEAINPVFSPDGKVLAFAANRTLPYSDEGKITGLEAGRTLQLWETSNEAPTILDANIGFLRELTFSPDGRFLLATDSTAHLYDVKSKRLLAEFGAEFAAESSNIAGLEFSPDGKYLVGHTPDGMVNLWDLNPWRSLAEIDTRTEDTDMEVSSIISADLDSDGKLLVTTRQALSGVAGIVTRVWEPGSGRIVNEARFQLGITLGMKKLSPDGKFIMTTAVGLAQIWDASSGQLLSELRNLPLSNAQFSDAQFSPDGKIIISRDAQTVKLWDSKSGAPLGELKLAGERGSTVLSTSGQRILIVDDQGTRILDVGSKQVVMEVAGLKEGLQLREHVPYSFSPDDKLIMGIWDTLEVRDAVTGRVVTELRGHTDTVSSASFSPDSKYIVTTSAFHQSNDYEEKIKEHDNEVRVWDASSGNTIYEFRDHSGEVAFAKFSRDGKFVLANDKDGTVRLYACDLCVSHDELLKQATKRRMRELTPDERARYLY